MSTERLSRREFLKLLLLFASTNFIPAASLPPSHPSGNPDLPDIIILVFDTLSARHLSYLGYRRNTAPNLARFAERATVFHRHYAGGNFTVPGTASLLTGAYPWSHRGMHLFGSVKSEYISRNIFSVFTDDYYITTYTHNPLVMDLFAQFHGYVDKLIPPRDLAVLSEQLADRLFPDDYYISLWGERIMRGSGYETPGSLFLSYTGLEGNFNAQTPDSLKRKYGSLFPRGLPEHSTGLFFLLETAIDWIKTQVANAPRPFLDYFHLLPPHEPYNTRKEFIGIFDDGWRPVSKPALRFSQNYSDDYLAEQGRYYDEYIAYADAEFGRLYDFLVQSGVLDHTYLIVTSDHGQLFERGIHGHVTPTLYDPIIHIPLLVAKPGQRQREDVFTPTSCVDLLPTLCHITGKAIPDWCEGQVLPGLGGPAPDPNRGIYTLEAKENPKSGPIKIGTAAMIQGSYKLVHYFGYPQVQDVYELYDLADDPQELVDRYDARQAGISSELKEELAARLVQANQAG